MVWLVEAHGANIDIFVRVLEPTSLFLGDCGGICILQNEAGRAINRIEGGGLQLVDEVEVQVETELSVERRSNGARLGVHGHSVFEELIKDGGVLHCKIRAAFVFVRASGGAAQVCRQMWLHGVSAALEERRDASGPELSSLRLEVLHSTHDTHVGG